ncbi:MAG: adenylate/guanylate cyclase domain-containing protein, partial [Hyphomicrobiales bacterium]|nr:adenylate/guanylate cyclase domain-containing protein [Hyphomicrobiales bacterium]
MAESAHRQLAAILSADVVGYSRLMGEDETATLSALRRFRSEFLRPTIDSHHGAIVKSMGDGWLIKFASVVDAINCAIRLQEQLTDEETFKIRIGVHLGDITHEDEDIYGDGVNVAARLQEISEPGAVAISDVAWRSVDGKLSAMFTALGPVELKNITRPVSAYGWGMSSTVRTVGASTPPEKPS